MADPNISTSVSLSISSQEDASGAVIFSKSLSQLYDGVSLSIQEFFQLLFSGSNGLLQLPSVPVRLMYLKNLSKIDTITVQYTQNSTDKTVVLSPGDFIFLFVGNTNSQPITAILITYGSISQSNCPIEYVLGG